jgi:hypothetical protein
MVVLAFSTLCHWAVKSPFFPRQLMKKVANSAFWVAVLNASFIELFRHSAKTGVRSIEIAELSKLCQSLGRSAKGTFAAVPAWNNFKPGQLISLWALLGKRAAM